VGERQPSEVSQDSSFPVGKPSSGLGVDQGARVIDSTPPARTMSASQAAGAQPVDGDAGDGGGQPREQQRHARHVAVVLAGLVGAAQEHLVHRGGLQPVARHERAQHVGGEIIRPHALEGAPVLANGGTDRVDDERLGYGQGLLAGG
jgi:hypothetical protein